MAIGLPGVPNFGHCSKKTIPGQNSEYHCTKTKVRKNSRKQLSRHISYTKYENKINQNTKAKKISKMEGAFFFFAESVLGMLW